MSRQNRFDWFAAHTFRRKGSTSKGRHAQRQRKLRYETLEDRRLLAITVDTLFDEDDGPGVGAGTSLRDAIAISSPGDTINFSVAGTINLSPAFGELVIDKSLTIDGPGNDPLSLTINAGHGADNTVGTGDGFRVFRIDDANSAVDRSVTILDVTITGGDVAGDGGAILSQEDLTLTRLSISDNAAIGRGGGIYAGDAGVDVSLTLNFNLIDHNVAGGGGGGLFAARLVTMTGGIFEFNAGEFGGGFQGVGNIDGVLFADNTAGTSGGGISATGSISIANSLFRDNEATGNANGTRGGALSLFGDGDFTNTTITGNSATRGGGLYIRRGADVTFANTTITSNDATDGGGIFAWAETGKTINIVGPTITGNTASDGGGVYAKATTDVIPGYGYKSPESQKVVITGATIKDNLGTSGGGGVYLRGEGGQVELRSSTVSGNNRASQGSGVYIYSQTASDNHNGSYTTHLDGRAIVSNSTVSGNLSYGSGGGVYIRNETNYGYSGNGANTELNAVVAHTTIAANSTNGVGGGVRLRSGRMLVENSIVAGNTNQETAASDLSFGSGAVSVSAKFDVIGSIEPGEEIYFDSLSTVIVGDPTLKPLADYGGPTFTHALPPGSIAVNAGGPSLALPADDQRGTGFDRVVDGQIDVGAFENQGTTLVIDTLTDISNGDYSTGDLSLREAISLSQNANSLDARRIAFDPSLFSAGPATITLTNSELLINADSSIIGPGANLLTIDASGNDPTPGVGDGQGSRIFRVLNGATDVVISGLTLTGGDADNFGGAIYADAPAGSSLSLVDMTIDGNTTPLDGGGVYAQADLQITDSRITANFAGRNGGGLAWNGAGSLSISSTQFSGNTGQNSGGGLSIENDGGQATVELSTFTNNAAQGSAFDSGGGGIHIVTNATPNNTSSAPARTIITSSTVMNNRAPNATGGGIAATKTTGSSSTALVQIDSLLIAENEASSGGGLALSEVDVVNSTVTGNMATTAGGGVFSRSAVLDTLRHSTITNNHAPRGGGAYWVRSLGLDHAIIAGNSSNATDGPDLQPAFSDGNSNISSIFSLIGDNRVRPGFLIALAEAPVGSPDGSGNIVGGSANGVINARLQPLDDYGGPTLTHSIMPQSPAFNAGAEIGSAFPDYDQRGPGFPRNGFGPLDIGAFELSIESFSGALVVDELTDVFDHDFSPGNLSLREAITVANLNVGEDTITFDPGLFGSSRMIFLNLGELLITGQLTIEGPEADLLSIDAQRLSRVLNFSSATGDLNISGLTIVSGYDVFGGGIHFDSDGTLTISGSAIKENEAIFSGGGISTNSGNVVLQDSLVSGNLARGSSLVHGGGISTNSGNVVLRKSLVKGNTAGDERTGVFAKGGGISTVSGDVFLEDSLVSGNIAESHDDLFGGYSYSSGGGISTNSGSVVLSNSLVSGNRVSSDFKSVGGGIDTNSGSVNLTNSTVSGNMTETNNTYAGGDSAGGGIATETGSIMLQGATVAHNQAGEAIPSYGGGIYFLSSEDSSLTMENSIVANNVALSVGADIFSSPSGMLTINHSLIGVADGLNLTGNIGNQTGTAANPLDPMLGPLGDNGGPTQTHALLSGSPAIDTGDPSILFNATEYDQRGAPFVRVFDSRIDIGAYEVQPPPQVADADFDQNNVVDGADFLTWQRGFGTTSGALKEQGDADNDGDVDGADLVIWKSQFGDNLPPPLLSTSNAAASGQQAAALSENATWSELATHSLVEFQQPTDKPDFAKLITTTHNAFPANASLQLNTYEQPSARRSYNPSVVRREYRSSAVFASYQHPENSTLSSVSRFDSAIRQLTSPKHESEVSYESVDHAFGEFGEEEIATSMTVF